MDRLELLQEQCSICSELCGNIKGVKDCRWCETRKEIMVLTDKESEEN